MTPESSRPTGGSIPSTFDCRECAPPPMMVTMRSLPRLMLLLGAACWVAGIVAFLVPDTGPVPGAALLTASVLAVGGAALVLLRRLTARVDALDAGSGATTRSLKWIADRLPSLPSSSGDWTPRSVDAATIAAMQGLSTRIDLLAVLTVGDPDAVAVVETLSAIDEERPATVLVLGEPATALAIAAVAPSPRVIAVTHLPQDAARFRAAADRLGLGRRTEAVEVAVRSEAGPDGRDGYDPAGLDALPEADLLVVAGPPWALGPSVRSSVAAYLRSGPSGARTILVTDPHRPESQAFVADLGTGFVSPRESRGALWLRRTASSTP